MTELINKFREIVAAERAAGNTEPLGSALMQAVMQERVSNTDATMTRAQVQALLHDLATVVVDATAWLALVTYELTSASPAKTVDVLGRDAKITVLRFGVNGGASGGGSVQ